MANRRVVDLETQLKDIRRQLNDQLGCLEFRVESKISLLSEFQEFFKRRGEVEYEYARNLERLCEKFEKNTKQRNIRNEVRSTFNLWSTLLAETRKLSRERANLAEVMASEMVSRLEIMAKDVHMLAKKCKDMCIEIQDQFLKELRDLSEETKVYQISCHNTAEAHNKLVKSQEKLDATRGSAARRKKAEEKHSDRQRHFKAQKHLLLKNRNDYIVGISKCNAFAMQYFNMDIMDVVEYMDFDYHASFRRFAAAYRESEHESCEALMASADNLVEQAKSLNFENDLHYFLSEYSQPFTPPNPFQFTTFEGDSVSVFKVNTEDVFKRAQKVVQDLTEEKQCLEIQREEDTKTIQHMEHVNLKRYQVTTVDDALAVLEDNGEQTQLDLSGGRGTASLERGLSLTTKAGQAIQLSQKGKKDTVFFTLQVVQRRIHRSDRLALVHSQLDIVEKALDEQKVPPMSVVLDEHGHSIPGEVPKLFGGDCLEYIMATGCDIPLIVTSCVRAIEKEGMQMEGLFRVPGPAAYTDELRKAFEEGRDPLAYSGRKVDVAAVASVLKAYFRELSTPLFPTNKYSKFIECTRFEELQDRLDAIRDTVNSLHPAVITVMRFLFKFLYRVAQYSAENKMGSANLALVFGPTLTRAPDTMDPRQLHNDVPAINILIQFCIDRYDYVFGEEDDEEEAFREGSTSPRTLSPTQEQDMSSPPAVPPAIPPSVPRPISPAVPPPQVIIPDTGESRRERFAASPSPQPGDQPPPPVPPREPSPMPTPVSIPEPTPVSIPEPEPPQAMVPVPTTQPEPPLESLSPEDQLELPRPMVVVMPGDGMGRQESGVSLTTELTNLDETLKDLEEFRASLDEGEGSGGVVKVKRQESELDDDEESSDEDEQGVMTIQARALYDYTSRSDKELSFTRGDILHVIEKTPDHNWWDGFYQSRRGFIPVAYVEIVELPQQPQGRPGLLRPPPPERKSSIPAEEAEKESLTKISESPLVDVIHEEDEERKEIEVANPPELMKPVEPEVQYPEVQKLDTEMTMETEPAKPLETKPPETKPPETKPPEGITESPSRRLPTVPVSHGAVKSLTQQFAQPQQRVLVEPHSHRRQLSDVPGHKRAPSSENGEPFSRSGSTGSKASNISKLSSAFEHKPAPPPPLVKPKPHPHVNPIPQIHPPVPHVVSPGADQTGGFTILPHSSIPGASPLQKAAYVGKVGHQPQPMALPKKPAPPPSKPQKSSFKGLKREKSKKEDKKPPVVAKPPVQGFVPPPGTSRQDRTVELQHELQQAAYARRKTLEDLK